MRARQGQEYMEYMERYKMICRKEYNMISSFK